MKQGLSADDLIEDFGEHQLPGALHGAEVGMRTEALYNTIVDQDARSTVSRELLSEVIIHRRISPYFQPIVDLATGNLFGYEVLSRATAAFADPEDMFDFAETCGLSQELEEVCIEVSLAGIAEAAGSLPGRLFSFNVGPNAFVDPRIGRRLSPAVIAGMGLDADRLIIEFTEREVIDDYRRFGRLVRDCVAKGFRIALDDFGSGSSGLRALSELGPHFVKLDRSMIAGIENNAYVQNIIKAMVSLIASGEGQLIAEGVETEAQLLSVLRLGVRYAQGSLLGRAEPTPRAIDGRATEILRRTIDYSRYSRTGFRRTSIGGMAVNPPCFQKMTTTCGTLKAVFLHDSSLGHVILLDGKRATGVITRSLFLDSSNRQRYPACGPDRLIDEVAASGFLSVDETFDIRALIRLALDRRAADFNEPIVVTGPGGAFVGTITMKQLFAVAMDVEVEIATSLNPLTRLPGNIVITRWLEEVFKLEHYAVIYADLTRFKEFNERYGFIVGDDLIGTTARLFAEYLPDLSLEAKLGHIGGDDFIIVSDRVPSEATLAELCAEFDLRRQCFFAREEVEKGWYSSTDRCGRRVRVPLVSVTLAVVTSENFNGIPHPALISQIATMLKLRNKQAGQKLSASRYLFERRRYSA